MEAVYPIDATQQALDALVFDAPPLSALVAAEAGADRDACRPVILLLAQNSD